jgi:hypothetical protein
MISAACVPRGGTIRAHHEGFEGAATVLCGQVIFADLLRFMLFEDGSGRTSFDVASY